MYVIWYECKWDCWQGWCHEGETPDEWVWSGCGCDASEEHQGGPHKWIRKGRFYVDDNPPEDQYIG